MGHSKKKAASALGFFLLRASFPVVGLCLLLQTSPVSNATESSAMGSRTMQEEQHLRRLVEASKPGPIAFDIPSQAIAPALIQFGEQAGMSVLIQHEASNGGTAGLTGAYPRWLVWSGYWRARASTSALLTSGSPSFGLGRCMGRPTSKLARQPKRGHPFGGASVPC